MQTSLIAVKAASVEKCMRVLLGDLRRKGRLDKPLWATLSGTRRRKTLVVRHQNVDMQIAIESAMRPTACAVSRP